MLAPGALYHPTTGAVISVTSAGPTAHHVNQGSGFDAVNDLLLDSNAVAANSPAMNGIARNPGNCHYVTTVVGASDVFKGGLRISQAGALVVAVAVPVRIQNGDPFDGNGALCVTA